MIYVPPLHAELMSTTALTPTHHKGALRTVATIAVAIAIPALAPGIAASIGLSSVIGTIAASAVVGGAIGALSAKVLGGDWKTGALGGAFAGGLGGFAEQGGFSGMFSGPGGGAAPLPTTPGYSLGNVAGTAPTGFGTPGLTSGGGLLGPPSAIGAGAPAGFTLGAAPSFDPITGSFIPGGGGGSSTASLGSTLSTGSGSPGLPPGVIQANYSPMGSQISGNVPQPGMSSGINLGGGGTSAPRPGYWSDPIGQLRSAAQTAAPASGAVTPLVAPGAQVPGGFQLSPVLDAAGQIAPEPGFFAGFGDKLTAGVKSAFDPEKLAEKGLDVAGRLALDQAAGYFADDIPVNPEEEARLASLARQQAGQERLQGEQEKIALGLANQARSVQVSGQPESKAAKITAARAGETYIRGAATPALEAARRRQVNLDIAKRGGTAQIQGRTSGEERYRGLLTAAAGILPTGSALVSSARADLKASNERFLAEQAALGKQQKSFASIFGGLLPTGEDTDKDIEDARKRIG